MKYSAPMLDAVRDSKDNPELAQSLRDLADSVEDNEVYFREVTSSITNNVDELGIAHLKIEFVLKPEEK